MPVSVAIAFVKNSDDELLLIRRVRGDYVGYWGLPGGKIEDNEHISESAVREIIEETDVSASFLKYLGTVSEILRSGKTTKHFLLHIVELRANHFRAKEQNEGESRWFSKEDIESWEIKIIPSDKLIIRNFWLAPTEKIYFNCKMRETRDKLVITYFD